MNLRLLITIPSILFLDFHANNSILFWDQPSVTRTLSCHNSVENCIAPEHIPR